MILRFQCRRIVYAIETPEVPSGTVTLATAGRTGSAALPDGPDRGGRRA